MQTFTIVYAENQCRQWSLDIEAESVEQVRELFESSNEDIWSIASNSTYSTQWGLGKESGEAVDTFDTEWHVEDESGEEYAS